MYLDHESRVIDKSPLISFSFVVDKALLETPWDEIDHQRLPIKDLILHAEYRERSAVHCLYSNSCDDVFLFHLLHFLWYICCL
jgi:hypothetical protein